MVQEVREKQLNLLDGTSAGGKGTAQVRGRLQDRAAIPQWIHWGGAMALTIAVAILDVTKPGNRGFSIFYLVPALYVGWTVHGRALVVCNAFLVITVFLAPWIAAPQELSPGGIRNRSFGVVIGAVMAYLLWDRRRSAIALERTNSLLEERVAARTKELEEANRSLCAEIQVRQQAEDSLRQAQKMEAIGRLAGGVAHDFNNLLTVINGYAVLLQEMVPAKSPARDALEQIASAGSRAADVTHKLLAFSRRQFLEPTLLNMNEVLAGTERLLRRLLPENISVQMHFDPSVTFIRADRSELERALLNLAANARDAMPTGGEFRLTTGQVDLSEAQAALIAGAQPGPHVRLTVADTGCGMDEAVRQHIFEPFFTTKEVGKGTGLGLAGIYGVVHQLGGCIEVNSQVGQGTTFTILLPCAADTVPREEHVAARPFCPTVSTETILLAEDDAAVRDLTTIILGQAGYTLLTACNGREAADLLTRHTGRIDLVITDVVMPQLSGAELAGLAALERPDIKILFVSGYSGNGSMLEAASLSTGAIPLLTKPYTAQTLLAKVGELLRQGHQTPA